MRQRISRHHWNRRSEPSAGGAHTLTVGPPLPAEGRPVTGVVDLGDQVLAPQMSGYDGPSARLPRPHPGMDRNLMAHVEAHTVAAMRENGARPTNVE